MKHTTLCMTLLSQEMPSLGKELQEAMPSMAGLVCATESSMRCLCSDGQGNAGGHGSHALNGRPG